MEMLIIFGCISAGKVGTGCCGAPDYSLCDDGADDGLDYCLDGKCK